MTSGNFTILPIDQITVDRDARQRRELKDIDKLANSIDEVGLINPLVITKEHVLVAGERRYTAIRQLGWTQVPVQFAEDLDEPTLHLIELEENIKRSELGWKDHCQAIDTYHKMRKSQDAEWTLKMTGSAVGYTHHSISRILRVAAELRAGNPLVVKADKFSVASNIAERQHARNQEVENERIEHRIQSVQSTIGAAAPPAADIDDDLSLPDSTERAKKTKPFNPPLADHDLIQCADFTAWAPSYDGRPFNFIHCDFPYGVDADKHDQGAADKFGGYEDTFKIYESLITTLAENRDKLMAQSCHVMFWFSMDYYDYTLTRLTEDVKLAVNPFPLVWYKSDNSGILPDPARGPRRNYETAFLCSAGDRKIVQAVSNVFPAPGRKKNIHMSEKNPEMLGHFFRMFVDNTSRVFDPTAGSGNALKVARSMGASAIFGLELDPRYRELALVNLSKPDDWERVERIKR